MRPSRPLASALIAIQVALAGCSSARPQITSPGQVDEIKQNNAVTLEMRDGSYVQGKFRGTTRVGPTAYGEEYESRRYGASGEALLPRLGTVEILADESSVVHGTLVGFDVLELEVLQPNSRRVTRLAYDRVRAITDSDGAQFEGKLIAEMANSGSIPSLYQIELDSDGGHRLLEARTVRAVHWDKGGENGGTFVVAALIVAVVALVASSGDVAPTPSPTYSCPYIYSWDGSDWALEAEVFGGSLVAAGQRTDTTGLRRARAADGELLLRVRNELNETQYVDSLRAYAVDHAPGVLVVPAEDGTPVALATPRAPIRARTLDGQNVNGLVSYRDESTWTSHPGMARRTDSDPVRDGVIVDFERPAHSSTVQLALRLRNTAWGAYLQGHVNTLLGADPEAWYQFMESSPAARDRWKSAALREAMLRVQVQTSAGWRTVNHVWEVGPTVMRDRGLQIDLDGVAGDTLRLKLDATAGLWEIDAIEADFAAAAITQITELELLDVREADGRDLTAALLLEDGERFEMPPFEGDAIARFAAPPLREGRERSFLLSASGYYRIHTYGQGAPRLDLLGRLMDEPGAFGRYVGNLWNKASVALLSSTDPGGELW